MDDKNKNLVDLAQLKEACSGGGHAALYAFCFDNGAFSMNNQACHAGMGYPKTSRNAYQKKDPRFVKDVTNVPVYGLVTYYPSKVPQAFFDMLLNPDVSPWPDVAANSFLVPATEKNPDWCAIATVCGDLKLKPLMSFSKTQRVFIERPTSGELLSFLIDKGVHPKMALWLSQFWGLNGPRALQSISDSGGWHGSFIESAGIKMFENYIKGDGTYKDASQKSFRDGSTAYAGVDSLFSGGTEKSTYGNYLRTKYKDIIAPPKNANGRFAKGVEIAALTSDKLAEIAILEQREYGLEEIDEDR